VLTPVDYRGGGGRGPFRVHATDGAGNYVTLAYFNNPGWARKQLPLSEPKLVSGRLDRYGQELQMVHPDHVLPPGEGASLPDQEPVYRLSEGLTNNRLGQLAAQALGRAPELAEWIEPGLLARRGWQGWRSSLHQAHRDRFADAARERLAYDEVFANQLALSLVRASNRKRRGTPLQETGAFATSSSCPTRPPAPRAARFRESKATCAGDADAAPAPGRCRLRQDAGGADGAADRGRGRRAGALLAPTEILARQHFDTLSRQLTGIGVNVAILTGREKGRAAMPP
jgi:ATP-dependent DNA helicase RecG